MTNLVKSDAAAGLDAPLWPSHASAEVGAEVEDLHTLELRAEITALHEQLTNLRRESDQRIAQARIDGAAEARAKFKTDETVRTAALEKALARIDAQLQAALPEVEALALVISNGALAAVFDESVDMQERVTRSINRQLNLVRREGVARVAVSAEDFPSASAVAVVRERLDLGHMEIATDPALKAGDSRLELTLGAVEISLTRYWSEISATLERSARGGPL